jgi:hypothetical protein
MSFHPLHSLLGIGPLDRRRVSGCLKTSESLISFDFFFFHSITSTSDLSFNFNFERTLGNDEGIRS